MSLPQLQPDPSGPTTDERNLAIVAHLAPLAGYVVAIGQILIPLLIYLLATSTYVKTQAKEALNAQISFTAYFLVAGFLLWFLVGFLLLPILAVFVIWTMVSAFLTVSKGHHYRYPGIFRLLT